MQSRRTILSQYFRFSIRTLVVWALVASVVLIGVGYWLRWPEIVMTIESDISGAEVYAGPQLLGRPPIYLSKQQVARFRLGDSALDPNTLKWAPAAVGGVLIRPSQGPGTLIWVKVPEGMEEALLTDETPWGPAIRCETEIAIEGGRMTLRTIQPRAGALPIRGQVLVRDSVDYNSKSFHLEIQIQNSGPREWKPDSPSVNLRVDIGSFTSKAYATHSRHIEINFKSLDPGAHKQFECDLPTPNVPGEYYLQASFVKDNFSEFGVRFPAIVLRVK